MKTLICLALLAALPAVAQTNLQARLEKVGTETQPLISDAMEFFRAEVKTVERSNRFLAWFESLASSNAPSSSTLDGVSNRIFTINQTLAKTKIGPVTFTNHMRMVVADVDIVGVGLVDAAYKIRRGVGGGYVKLELLPPSIQAKLGYDPLWSIGKEFYMFRETRQKAEARKRQALMEQESARVSRERENALTAEVGVLSAQTKVIEEIGDYSKLAYVIQIANRHDRTVVNDVRVNLLDAQGFILEANSEYNFETPARTTNELRGTFFLKALTADRMARTEATLKERKEP